MAAKRKRDVPLLFWVSEEEKAAIHEKMNQLGTNNLSAYLRKMALDGYVVNLDLPELRELLSLLRRSSSNLNQLTKRVNASGRMYHEDLENLQIDFTVLLDMTNVIVEKLASLH